MKWHVGDVAIILYSPRGNSIGKETEILSELHPALNTTESGQIQTGDLVHEIYADIANPSKATVARPEWLGKLPDGSQASTWDECAFKPKELVRCGLAK